MTPSHGADRAVNSATPAAHTVTNVADRSATSGARATLDAVSAIHITPLPYVVYLEEDQNDAPDNPPDDQPD